MSLQSCFYCAFCAFILPCVLVPVNSLNANLPNTKQYDTTALGFKDFMADNKRQFEKRAMSAAAKGLAAAEKLLLGAKKRGRPSKTYRLYTKQGNLKTAIDDYESVNPRNALNANTRKRANQFYFRTGGRTDGVKVGQVGDRRLILLLNGDKRSGYNPVLEIRTATDALHDRIVYRMD